MRDQGDTMRIENTTLAFALLLSVLSVPLTSCIQINAPEGSPDDVGRFTDGLVRFTLSGVAPGRRGRG